MANNSFLSSLSFFNDEYRGLDLSEPESTAQSAQSEPRLSSPRIPRKPLRHYSQRTALSLEANDDERLLPPSPDPYSTQKVPPRALKNSHKFIRQRQLRKLLFKGFLRFLLTVTLTATLLWTLFGYSKKTVLIESQKKIFNSIVTALSMCLGIAIARSFKEVAVQTRWWILSRRKRPLSEVDAILECESLTSLAVLAVKSTLDLKPKIALACSLWVLINIAAQAGVAMIGLTYSLNNGVDYNTGVMGDVLFTDMSRSFAYSIDYDTIPASELAAHTYGEMALAWAMGIITDTETSLPVKPLSAAGSIPYAYWGAPNYFQYVFMESSANTDSNSSPIDFYSNRSIKTSGSCFSYPVQDNVNGSSQLFTVDRNGTLYSPEFEYIGPNSTTYYTQLDMECGPRCKQVCAYENNSTAAFYYECNITVSAVSNVSYPSQNVSDENALMAAGAIGLQGYQQYSNSQPMAQYQQFPAESTYGHFVGDGVQMALLISQFAIGVFVTADQIMQPIRNPVKGLLPLEGVTLSVDKPAGMWAIFISIVVSHLVLFIVGSFLANRVVVVDDSYLAIALLLRPITEKMANQGFLLGGERSFPAMEKMNVVYGKSRREKEEDGVMGLEIGESADRERNPSAWEGFYDS